jgi:hypothetical protein
MSSRLHFWNEFGINTCELMGKKNPHAVALGKMGGSKGGKTRAAKLTPEQLSESARKAALARWGGDKRKQRPS